MKTLRDRPTTTNRQGFTKVELLVVIGAGVVLFAVTMPGLFDRRHASRRAQCLSNMNNVSLSVINFSTSNNGRLPRLSRNWTVEAGSPAALQAGSTVIQYGWMVDLLPHLDKEPLARAIAAGSIELPTDPVSGKLVYPKIAVAVCPRDTNNFRQDHGLSYVANAGYMNTREFGAANSAHDGLSIDYTGDGVLDNFDVIVARATGVFWRSLQDVDPAGNEIAPMSLDDIAASDGQTQTIMLAESIQARFYTSPMTADVAFGIINPIPTPTTATKVPSLKLPVSFKLRNRNNNATGPWDAINSDLQRPPGTTSRPSSNHRRQFNVTFCDGRAVTFSEKMDEAVYARMLTPKGSLYGQPVILND